MTKNKKTFYITTPIYYTNAQIHLGGAYTTIAADVLARWHRINGEEVFFLTGTDEHGQKIQEIAEKNKQTPQKFVDGIVSNFKQAFKKLNISNDNFIRTTDPYHEEEVKRLLTELYNKKLIYKGNYESYYCVGCEQYLTKSDLVNGCCPLHNREPELKKEEAYLFRLSKFQDEILNAIKADKLKILPEDRKKEVISFIKSGLQDISISRLKEKISWGIELPFDKKHTTWVWPDAFWNYISGIKQKGKLKRFWPVDVQLMAKDIIRVHSTIWPALLLGAGYKLPKAMFVHGYFTIRGQKMSKSLGNVISPIYLTEKYGVDTVRYYLMRSISFGSDGDVSEQGLIERHNTELANKLGNLISRVSALAERYNLKKKKIDTSRIEKTQKNVEKYLSKYEIDKALNEIFSLIDKTNELIQDKKPWEENCSDKSEILYEAVSLIKAIAILLSPFMPETCEKIGKIFNFNIDIKEILTPIKLEKIKKSEILFNKIDVKEKQENTKINKSQSINKKMIEGVANIVQFPDWQKIDLRVGEIKKVEDIANADKLYKIQVNIGRENRTVCAGLKQFYSKEDLKGKKVILFSNLAPRIMKGIESQGMLLAAVNQDETQVSLIQPDSEIENGSKVM